MAATLVAPPSNRRNIQSPSTQIQFSRSPLRHQNRTAAKNVRPGTHAYWDRLHFTPELATSRLHPSATESAADLPDPERFVGLAARCAAEILAGQRPVEQLSRWLSPDLYSALARRTGLAMRLLGKPAARTCLHVRSTRLYQVSAGVYEAAVLLDDGKQVRAAALRIEAQAQRWVVTHLDIG